ncbi:MAG TPA: heavy-metal-associated domain-containing protein [Castellaniella sp.]|uniref:heavy-metal-associated domain-containing protein n=1 Tax=Castellaniella sp. TaxID=1955812 RepID=UPI002EE26F5E
MKTEFIVSDMTCNHCVQTITRAVKAIAPTAHVDADLASHRVTIEPAENPAALAAAIVDAGYDVQTA